VAVRAFYDLLDMLWLGLLFCLRGVMTLLDWAFALNPFEAAGPDGQRSMGGLERALTRFFGVIDAGYFSAVIACIGLYGMWEGIVRRRAAGVCPMKCVWSW